MEHWKEAAQQRAAICGIFSNARRVLILWALVEEELPVSEIAYLLGVSLQNTSQHLRLMKSAGIVISRREGKTVYYSLAKNRISETCQLLTQAKKGQIMRR